MEKRVTPTSIGRNTYDLIDFLVQQKLTKKARIVQRNLIYISGLPEALINKKILQGNQFFGQYGQIEKITMCRQKNRYYKKPQKFVYIYFSNSYEASLAVLGTNFYSVNGQKIHVSFGMSRFCHFFLMGKPCESKSCSYVHYIPLESDLTLNKMSVLNQNLKKVNEIDTLKFFMHQLIRLPPPQIKQQAPYSFFYSLDQVLLKIKILLDKNYVKEIPLISRIKFETFYNLHEALKKLDLLTLSLLSFSLK